MKIQAGFTLIELMISLALGLVISAAAIMLFLTGQRSYSLQQGVADLQDNANFGLNYVTKDIRLTNLNIIASEINDRTSYGGLVLTSSVNADIEVDTSVTPNVDRPLSNIFRTITGDSARLNLLSRSQGDTAGNAPLWTGASNVQLEGNDILSDQLVIQYRPQYVLDDRGTPATNDDAWVGGFDCEGQALDFPVENPGGNRPFGQQMIVQRYFLREDNNNFDNEPNRPLALACEAGFYSIEGSPDRIQGGAPSQVLNTSLYGATSGQIIMKRVDHFRILLGVQIGADFRYISISDYMDSDVPRPRILSVQLGLLVRSAQSVGNDNMISDDQVFQILDQSVTVKAPNAGTPKYVRQVVSQTVALRNTFGERNR